MRKIEPDSDRTTLLFLCWRDIKSSKKGGAEVYTHNMLRRLPKERFRIMHLSPLEKGLPPEEELDGILYLRSGNILSVIARAIRFYRKNRANIDFVVDQCNTHRFFTPLWAERKKRIFFIHQLTREIWDINLPFPVSWFGKITEMPFLRLSRKDYALTVSESTRQDLIDAGFNRRKIFILPEGLDFVPWIRERWEQKEPEPTFVYVGRYSHYKGIDAAISAFGRYYFYNGKGKLWIIGKKNDSYAEKVLEPLMSIYHISDRVKQLGFVSEQEKLKLMSRSHALLFPSRREGWGLTVSEAAVVGTPSIVYNSPGLRDAVDRGRAGYLCSVNSPHNMVDLMNRSVEDETLYNEMREAAYRFSSKLSWDKTAETFIESVDEIKNGGKSPEILPGRLPLALLLLTSYNDEEIIEQTLRSCLNQQYGNLRVILVDDGSEDKTQEIALRMATSEPQLSVIRIPHGERGAARKKGFEEAGKISPDFICFIDSDMEPEPDMVSGCVADMLAKPETDALVLPESAWSPGKNLMSRIKVFERNTVNNSGSRIGLNSIEAARFWRYSSYRGSGGINFDQIAFEEIQPTIRCLERGGTIRRAGFTFLKHNEGIVTLKGLFRKKSYYFSVMNRTMESEKGGFFKALRRWYFFRPVLYRRQNIVRYLRHPLLALGMFAMYAALTLSALTAFFRKKEQNPQSGGQRKEEERSARRAS